MHISKKEKEPLQKLDGSISGSDDAKKDASNQDKILANSPIQTESFNSLQTSKEFDFDNPEGISMADLIGPQDQPRTNSVQNQNSNKTPSRSVDDFDFDEEAFVAAIEEIEPIGNTGEIAKGSVIGIESDGVYVDIGGKAPGFMPKQECGLGVITNLKERFPKGLEVEVLVTREQNADGMVTISCRALALRKSWEKVTQLAKDGKVAKVKINGFNRGGVTCDLEGLRGFIPRSQLEDGANHDSLVGKTLTVAFLEVNPDARKLVLSEKRATSAARFAELEIGQLVQGKIAAIKAYGFFVDLDGVSGLLHHSMITNGSLRSLQEVFKQGDDIKALITELDPGRGRIGLNTALLEGPPGELLIEKEKVMNEAEERAKKARTVLVKKDQSVEDQAHSS